MELSKAFSAAEPDEKHLAAQQTKDCAVVNFAQRYPKCH